MPTAASPAWIAPVPNLLCVLRIVLAAAFPLVAEEHRFALIAVAGASDVLDGWIARRFHATSEIGRLLDGIADKLFSLSAIVTLVVAGVASWWGGLLVVSRDATVAAIALGFAARREWQAFREMKPRVLGKATTAAAFLWFATLTLQPLHGLRSAALALAALISVAAAIDYALQASRRARALAPSRGL